MQKKLTISIDEKIYKGLYRVVGPGKISHFIEDLVTPYVTNKNLSMAYKKMSQDKEREKQATEWSEITLGDINDETW